MEFEQLELKGTMFQTGSVHTEPEEFENAALFLRLGQPSTLICHEKGAF